MLSLRRLLLELLHLLPVLQSQLDLQEETEQLGLQEETEQLDLQEETEQLDLKEELCTLHTFTSSVHKLQGSPPCPTRSEQSRIQGWLRASSPLLPERLDSHRHQDRESNLHSGPGQLFVVQRIEEVEGAHADLEGVRGQEVLAGRGEDLLAEGLALRPLRCSAGKNRSG